MNNRGDLSQASGTTNQEFIKFVFNIFSLGYTRAKSYFFKISIFIEIKYEKNKKKYITLLLISFYSILFIYWRQKFFTVE